MRMPYTRMQQSVVNLSATMIYNQIPQSEINELIGDKPIRLMDDDEARAAARRLREHLEPCQGKRPKSSEATQ